MLKFGAVTFLIAVAVLTLRYPVYCLLLLLMAPLFKVMFMVKMPIFQVADITVIAAAFTILGLSIYMINHHLRPEALFSGPLLCYILLALLWLVGTIYSSSRLYAFEKSTRFALLSAIFFIAPQVFGFHHYNNLKASVKLIVVGSIIAAVGTLLMPHANYAMAETTARATFLGGNPLSIATITGLGLVILFFDVILPEKRMAIRICCLLLIGLLFFALIFSGSRGPFIGVLIIWILTLIIYFKKLFKVTFPLMAALFIIIISLAFIFLPKFNVARIGGIFQSSHQIERAYSSRAEMVAWTVKRIQEKILFGHGTGSFPVDRNGKDERYYPHNIFLEVAYELGISGTVVLLIFLGLIFGKYCKIKKILKKSGDERDPGELHNKILMIFLFLLIQALKSGDINDNRIMFMAAGMMVALYKCFIKTTSGNNQAADE